MQHLPQGVEDREGCFVYQYVADPPDGRIAVRSDLSVGDEYKTVREFHYGEMVSFDKIQHSRLPGSNNGPFLRLSDDSGWLFEKKFGKPMMKPIPVKEGLWSFYVDNVPVGIALRNHPVDRVDMRVKDVAYLPMQQIFCDRQVTHPNSGVKFYRVQGTNGWVFDCRIDPDSRKDEHFMLLDDTKVKKGFFIYKVAHETAIGVRNRPDVGESSRTGIPVKQNELVAIDTKRESPFHSGNGPFLRLTDGSGWLFENKYDERIMEQVPVKQGAWTFKVLNEPVGLQLRRQPIDNPIFFDRDIHYKPGDIVECTHVVSSNPYDPQTVKFYKVRNTGGWLFDKRDGVQMLQPLSRSSSSDLHNVAPSLENKSKNKGWTPDFVRGVAATVEGVVEISFNATSRVISFRTSDNTRINVYYTTKTLGTALTHPYQGATQLFRRNCSTEELVQILENPRSHNGKGYKRKRHNQQLSSSASNYLDYYHYDNSIAPDEQDIVVETEHGMGIMADVEDELRNTLLELDEEMEKIQKKKIKVLKKVRSIDLTRKKEAEDYEHKVICRKEEFDLREKERKQKEEQRQREKQQKEEEERMLRARTCYICNRVFFDAHAKNQHHEAVHVIRCNICNRIFVDNHALTQHINATGHW